MPENETTDIGTKESERQQVVSVRELLFHVNNVFHARVNLLLVAESIFFAAIATLWREQDSLIKFVVCGLGMVMTLVLWFANATLYKRSNVLTEKLKNIDSIYKVYLDAVSQKYVTVTGLLAHLLPFVFSLAWVVVILRLLNKI
jgi:hypothetical protein